MRMSLRFRGRGGGRRLWLEPAVSFVFELERERPVARLYDPPARQHVNDIGDDVIEQPLIVGDDDDGALRAPHRIDAVRDELECVDVEARIGFVEDRQLRLEHSHLKDLVALLLAAGEAFVDRTGEHARVNLEQRRLLAHQGHELEDRKSTRLNSSHGYISYAVFCLKKKK